MNTLRAHALSIGYRQRTPHVLAQRLELVLRPGTLTCLLGPNGVGKTTLLRTLIGAMRPLAGCVTVGGADVHRMSAHVRAQHLAVVFTERPNVGLLNGYALVALGRHAHTDWAGRLSAQDEDVVRWAVSAVGAEDVAAQPVAELSDGQRQKLLIARGLAQDAPVLVLDEPTAYLDLPRRAEMLHMLRGLAHETGRAVLLTTHDLDLALHTADEVWLLADGVLVVGAPEDLVLSGSLARAFAGSGLTFDAATGAFRAVRPARGSVVLVPPTDERLALAYTWTQRALARADYSVCAPSQAETSSITVHVQASAVDDVRWLVHLHGAAPQTFARLADVLATLGATANGTQPL